MNRGQKAKLRPRRKKRKAMALRRVWIPSPNYNAGRSSACRLIVLHTAEGARTYESLGNYFKGKVSASSHVGIDDKRGEIGEYVKRNNRSWTQSSFNSVAVSVELCGFASWTRNEWLNNHQNMLRNCADWIAEEAKAFGIPIVKLSASQAQGNGRGICQHADLGARGGGHWDCGPGFPIDQVISWAKGGGTAPAPPPPAPPKVPQLHVDYFSRSHNSRVADVKVWQAKMAARGWKGIGAVDGIFGPKADSVCRQFQREKGLKVDGMVGPQTWNKTWTAPVT